jgi:hypothetical protein
MASFRLLILPSFHAVTSTAASMMGSRALARWRNHHTENLIQTFSETLLPEQANLLR